MKHPSPPGAIIAYSEKPAMMNHEAPQPPQGFPPQSHGARQACRNALRDARTASGIFLPLTITEITTQLVGAGIAISERDVEGFVRELTAAGEVVEMDAQAGFRWAGTAA